jgi:hypothetical protein
MNPGVSTSVLTVERFRFTVAAGHALIADLVVIKVQYTSMRNMISSGTQQQQLTHTVHSTAAACTEL